MPAFLERMATALVSFSLLPLCAHSAYFNVHEGEEKCFVEQTPEHQVMTVKYTHTENPGVPCMLVFKDPRGMQVFSHRVGPEEKDQGKTSYMTQRRGEHRICVQCKGTKWFQTTALKWELHIDMGDTDWSRNPATRKELKGIEKAVASTLARTEAISAENEYEKISEMEFRDASELMNSHVVMVALFIMAMEAAAITWQVCHLRTFFQREKLI
mmetsp:Transcript_68239/g.134872  ORF Transcript_68239/g.134872 Transcript_68239/m.134872 type:complete len:213 (+) Transcript_68239:144-782(+)